MSESKKVYLNVVTSNWYWIEDGVVMCSNGEVTYESILSPTELLAGVKLGLVYDIKEEAH